MYDDIMEELTTCSRCYYVAPLSLFMTWNDEVTGVLLHHCDACASLTHCGVCGVEGHSRLFRTILQDDDFVMDVCTACDSAVATGSR
jgi:hypothetical protein